MVQRVGLGGTGLQVDIFDMEWDGQAYNFCCVEERPRASEDEIKCQLTGLSNYIMTVIHVVESLCLDGKQVGDLTSYENKTKTVNPI